MTSGPPQLPAQGSRPPGKAAPAGWYRPTRSDDEGAPLPETTWTSTPSWERERPQGVAPATPPPAEDVEEDSPARVSVLHRLPVVPIVLTALVCVGFAWVLVSSGYSSTPPVGRVVAGGTPAPDAAVDPAATLLGPLTFTLPADLGPWEPVPASVLAAPQALWPGSIPTASSAWKFTSSAGAEVAVTVYAAGTHSGAQSSATRTGAALASTPWTGPVTSATVESSAVDGTKSLTAFIDQVDGSLIQATVRAPAAVFDSASLSAVLTSATLTS